MESTQTVTQPRAVWPKDALRIGFGLIWAIDATLKWLPGFKDSYLSTIQGLASGQPRWLLWWFDFWTRIQQHDALFFWALVATTESLIAVALITGFGRKTTYIAAIVFSVLIWSTAEGFGGPYTSGASDIGTAIIYAVVFAGLLALSYYEGPARYSADYYLEKKYTWWWRIAELRRPVPEPTTAIIPVPRAPARDHTTRPEHRCPGQGPGAPAPASVCLPVSQRQDQFRSGLAGLTMARRICQRQPSQILNVAAGPWWSAHVPADLLR